MPHRHKYVIKRQISCVNIPSLYWFYFFFCCKSCKPKVQSLYDYLHRLDTYHTCYQHNGHVIGNTANGWMPNGSICFLISWHLKTFCLHDPSNIVKQVKKNLWKLDTPNKWTNKKSKTK